MSDSNLVQVSPINGPQFSPDSLDSMLDSTSGSTHALGSSLCRETAQGEEKHGQLMV